MTAKVKTLLETQPKVKATQVPHGVREPSFVIKDSHAVLFDEQYLSTLSYHTVPTTRAQYFELYDELKALPNPDERSDEQKARAKNLKSQLDEWKLNCPYFLLRTFRVGEGRTDDAVVTSKGLTLDIDETEAVSTQDALNHAHGVLTGILGDVPMVAYTSISHREHKPKLRFVIIYSGPISPGLQADFDNWLYQECASKGLVLDEKMKNLSQPAFLPVRFQDDTTAPEVYVYHGEGVRLNPAKFAQAIDAAPKAPKKQPKHREGFLNALADINSDLVKNHPIWKRVEDWGGSVGNGRTVLCPNHRQHTQEQNPTGCIMGIYPDGGIAHSCMHSHCQDLTGPKVLDIIEKEKPGVKAAVAEYMAEISAEADLALFEALEKVEDNDGKALKLDLHGDIKKAAAIKSEAKRDQIIKKLGKKHGVGITALKKDIKAARKAAIDANRSELEGNQKGVSKAIIDEYGANFLHDDVGAWFWKNGVWSMSKPDVLRQRVVKFCDKNKIDYSSGFIRSVADLIGWSKMSSKHEWNRGGGELLNCKNGEVFFKDGKWRLRAANRENYRTTQLPVEFNAEAKAPRFDRFLDEIFAGDEDAVEKRQLILEMMGYSLMTEQPHDKFAILVGEGRNGKSVLLDLLPKLVGRGNYSAVSPENFAKPFSLAQLHNKLVNVVGEVSVGAKLPDGPLKDITGRGLIEAEFKGQDSFRFQPYCTVWIGTNNMPHVRDFSEGMKARSMIVQFNNTFTGDPEKLDRERHYPADTGLGAELEAELPGILNMALAAYGEVMQRGDIIIPSSTREARASWELDSNPVARFFEERVIVEEGDFITSRSLFDSYLKWCEDTGVRYTQGDRGFGKMFAKLIKHTEIEAKRSNRARGYMNCRVMSRYEEMRDAFPDINNEDYDFDSLGNLGCTAKAYEAAKEGEDDFDSF